MEIHIREKCADCKGRGYLLRSLHPPEEIPCPSCEGKGVIEEWVSVRQLLEMLVAQK
jgi:DnaJ-class molecular chaperone